VSGIGRLYERKGMRVDKENRNELEGMRKEFQVQCTNVPATVAPNVLASLQRGTGTVSSCNWNQSWKLRRYWMFWCKWKQRNETEWIIRDSESRMPWLAATTSAVQVCAKRDF